MQIASKESNGAVPLLRISIIVWKQSIHYATLSAMFNLLHSSTNQELFEKHLCNQSNHYENNDSFCYAKLGGSHYMLYHQIDTFCCQQRWREHTGKSELYVPQYAKRHLSSWSNIEQWKNWAQTLNHCWTMLV